MLHVAVDASTHVKERNPLIPLTRFAPVRGGAPMQPTVPLCTAG
jgi:hypothetical protein